MTRIAAGSPAIWPDICEENSVAITVLALYSQRLSDELMFPGRTRSTRGKQISDRKRLFTKIAKLTREQSMWQTQYMRSSSVHK